MESDNFLCYRQIRMEAVRKQPIGNLLRQWRERRRMSQLDLALEAEISTRHLSFVETGRSQPSREMILHLAEQLGVPLRERNKLLVSGGYAPVFSEKALEDPTLQAARQAVELILKGHEPFPALAVDRHWTLIAMNKMIEPLLDGVSAELLAPPINVLRLTLHLQGLAPRIANFAEWRTHLLTRLRHQIDATADPILEALFKELREYPSPEGKDSAISSANNYGGIAVPFRLETEDGILSFLSTTTVFGTPVDITLSELAIESFFPADDETKENMRRISKRKN